jgi:hypothetical protein
LDASREVKVPAEASKDAKVIGFEKGDPENPCNWSRGCFISAFTFASYCAHLALIATALVKNKGLIFDENSINRHEKASSSSWVC